MNKDLDITKMVSNYFTLEHPLIINTDKMVCCNKEELLKLVENHRDYYDEMDLDYKNCLVNSNENVAWLVIHGIMKKIIAEDKALENMVELIRDILNSNSEDKEKLFRIRKGIANTLKESSRGVEYIWPFRFEAVLVKEKSNWIFHYLQFSFPFNSVLEGKTEVAVVM